MSDYNQLSDSELISTLICEKAGGVVSSSLLEEFNSLPAMLVEASEEELSAIKGMGVSRVKQLKAAYELARRLFYQPPSKQTYIRKAQDVADICIPVMRYLKREVFKVIFLNTKNGIIHIEDVSIGSLNSSIVHPREVFSLAVKRSASSVVFIHNHPSGDPEPSIEDIETTKRLMSSGDVLGIKILDHIIVGDGRYISLKERGVI
jgi:DNA repair protein RadC